MTSPVIITTYDWVPDFAKGYVRDLRPRWALEEIGRPYEINTVPVREKSPEHYARQPFGQVPLLQDGALSLFESGAILIHLAESTELMPPGDDRARTVQWICAGLNSVEPFSMQWASAKFFDKNEAAAAKCEKPLRDRLAKLQNGLAGHDWLVGGKFSVADILIADILRIPAKNGMLDDLHGLADYVERATGRPAFKRAYASQMAHWQEADTREAGTAK